MAKWDDEQFNTQTPPEDRIQCATCKYKLQPVEVAGTLYSRASYARCEKYDLKPQGILWDEEHCEMYEEE